MRRQRALPAKEILLEQRHVFSGCAIVSRLRCECRTRGNLTSTGLICELDCLYVIFTTRLRHHAYRLPSLGAETSSRKALCGLAAADAFHRTSSEDPSMPTSPFPDLEDLLHHPTGDPPKALIAALAGFLARVRLLQIVALAARLPDEEMASHIADVLGEAKSDPMPFFRALSERTADEAAAIGESLLDSDPDICPPSMRELLKRLLHNPPPPPPDARAAEFTRKLNEQYAAMAIAFLAATQLTDKTAARRVLDAVDDFKFDPMPILVALLGRTSAGHPA